MKNENISIIEEPNVIDDHLLDIIGSNFNFSHEKGLAEWLKNSIDAYIRQDIDDEKKHIIYKFTDEDENNPPMFETIDFVGMTSTDINKALKRWGDPEAAKKGAKKGIRINVHGGHGNGGKFYMRQMFKTSHFITYRDGIINVFGFNENKKYGFGVNFKDKKLPPEEAMKLANIFTMIPEFLKKNILFGKNGFTVVRGIRPKFIATKIEANKIINRLKNHPQARRALKSSQVSIIHNNKVIVNRLIPNEIQPMIDFSDTYIFEIPEYLYSKEGKKVEMANAKYQAGRLLLKTSLIPFGRSGASAELNCIDFLGETGVIASYKMNELGFIKYYPQAQFIYGECFCPILDNSNPDEDCVQNDREKLVENEKTSALLQWCAERVDELAEKIVGKEKEKKKKEDIKTSEVFNEFLNKWKNQFMSKFLREILGGNEKGDSTGGLGDEGSGGGKNEHSNTKGGIGQGHGKGGGEGDQKKKGSSFPIVLISGQEDPLNPENPVNFTERHNVVEQRLQDVQEHIFWINIDKKLAQEILNRYGKDSVEWRNYLYHCYVSIFITIAIEAKSRKEGGMLSFDEIQNLMSETISKVYDQASSDLEDFLLKEDYKVDNIGSKQ